MTSKIEFQTLIEQDRQAKMKKSWRGTLLDYLELVKQNPKLAYNAHQRMYDMIISAGVQELDVESDPRAKRLFGGQQIRIYNFFKDEFFGMERTIDKIVRYFQSAAMGGEEARQVLYLMGPVGSGKSSLVERLKRGLEELDPIYVIEGSPTFANPLCLIPRHLRPAFEEMLGVRIEGDIDPVTRWRLIHEFKGEYEKMPVVTMTFSVRGRRGSGWCRRSIPTTKTRQCSSVPKTSPSSTNTARAIPGCWSSTVPSTSATGAWWNSSRFSRTRPNICTR